MRSKKVLPGSGTKHISAAGLEPYTGSWTRQEAAHLARRVFFGATKSDIDLLVQGSMQQAVSAVLSTSATPKEPVAYVKSGAVAEGSSWVNATFESGTESQRLVMLQSWWIGEMLFQGKDKAPTITEKMTLFWHNHFATGGISVKDARYMYKQNAYLRANALGNVKNMVRDITFDPAMLRWLNNNSNTKSHPNENFARELQELFTIGKGAEVAPGDYTTYTESDIKAAAKVLTGWSDVQASMTAKFTASSHDTSTKTFSARYGNKQIKGGNTEAEARREINELLDMIFAQEATSKYIVRKIYRWFVDYIIDAQTESTIIEPLAQLLRTNNFEIKPVLETLLKSAHFYDASKRGCMIKSPADFMIGTLRTFYTPMLFLDESETRGRFWGWRTVRRTMSTLQMDLLNPPNVAGWAAYWQSPVFHELWINSDTLQKRVRFTNELCIEGYQLDENYGKTLIDVLELCKQSSKPDDVNTLINEWCELAYAVPVSTEMKAQFKQILLGGLPDYEWSVEWNDYFNDQQNATKEKAVADKLRAMLKYMLANAEYQLS